MMIELEIYIFITLLAVIILTKGDVSSVLSLLIIYLLVIKIDKNGFTGDNTKSTRSYPGAISFTRKPKCTSKSERYYPTTIDEIIDGDERNAYQLIARNDPIRAMSGTMRRQKDLQQYFTQELDDEENSRWWGQNEY